MAAKYRASTTTSMMAIRPRAALSAYSRRTAPGTDILNFSMSRWWIWSLSGANGDWPLRMRRMKATEVSSSGKPTARIGMMRARTGFSWLVPVSV